VAADHGDAALVELERRLTADEFLTAVDGGLRRFPLRREPEAGANELRILRDQLVLEMHGATVEREVIEQWRCFAAVHESGSGPSRRATL
jgi:hypothetical protein